MSDTVLVIAFPDDRRLGVNIHCDLGDTGYSSRVTVATDPIQDAISIRDQESGGRNVRMPSAQIPFLADSKLDMLGDQIDTVSQLNQPRIGPTRKTRIDFNDDWSTLRPPEFNVRWPPAKVESSQTAQRNVCDTFIVLIIQRGRMTVPAKDEMR
ncbi:hypothetical protein LCM4577_28505 [Mesorhizobium sp. LCM 4577]|nr:hypothetical protein LCM4577_28505 [Mesorhizobium sp. LCM 4577]